MNVLLISTYELGHQPFGLASAAAWLRAAGHRVAIVDLAVTSLPQEAVVAAELIGIYIPMHTATRLAARLIPRLRDLNPEAKLCCFGLYAPLSYRYLSKLGVDYFLGGEFEQALVELAGQLESNNPTARGQQVQVRLERLNFKRPDRKDLPPLARYARLQFGGQTKLAGYTEASRGCKHTCRHCPIVNVYGGRFRVVQREVVLEDVRQQVEAGAEHITFGDPDFFNGPTHALRIVESLHKEFPWLTYDVTIKIEHLKKHAHLLPRLKETGCLFITSAVESTQDEVLAKLQKGHTRQDFIDVAQQLRQIGLALNPTFIPFTPWTTLDSYRDLLNLLVELDLVDNTAPVQLTLKLLIPEGSRLLELPEIKRIAGPFDAERFLYPWQHADPEIEALQRRVTALVERGVREGFSRREIFSQIWLLVMGKGLPWGLDVLPRAVIPYLDEPWYC